MHFIFGFPYYNHHFVSFIFQRLFGSAKIYFTLLGGRQRDLGNTVEIVTTDSDKSKDILTIGDDIDLMYDQLKKYEKNKIFKSISRSIILEIDDNFSELECKRKSYTRNAETSKNIRRLGILIVGTIFLGLSLLFSSNLPEGGSIRNCLINYFLFVIPVYLLFNFLWIKACGSAKGLICIYFILIYGLVVFIPVLFAVFRHPIIFHNLLLTLLLFFSYLLYKARNFFKYE